MAAYVRRTEAERASRRDDQETGSLEKKIVLEGIDTARSWADQRNRSVISRDHPDRRLDEQACESSLADGRAPLPKRSYTRPTLTAFGRIWELTRAQGQFEFDGVLGSTDQG
jgi:hypothetical protein